MAGITVVVPAFFVCLFRADGRKWVVGDGGVEFLWVDVAEPST